MTTYHPEFGSHRDRLEHVLARLRRGPVAYLKLIEGAAWISSDPCPYLVAIDQLLAAGAVVFEETMRVRLVHEPDLDVLLMEHAL